MQRSVWTVLKLLVTSRKVWVASIGAGAAVYMHVKGLISADKLASALVALATAVIVCIAAEDSAGKLSGQMFNVTNTTAEPELIDFNPRCVECGAPAMHVAKGPAWYCDKHAPWDAIYVVLE